MKNKKPLVSILICSYNAEQFIESTVQSILSQTHTNFELLVLDNASTDKTVEVLEKIQKKDKRLVVFAHKTNLGAYPGLNYLLEKAKGDFIAINDHDDIWHPDKLEKQIGYLEKHKNAVGCGTAILNWYEEYNKGILRTQPTEHTVAWHTSLVYRNNGYRYDTSYPVGTDFYFMQNILCKDGATIHNLHDPYVFRRIWKGQLNLSSNWMKKLNITSILTLTVPFIDKLALLMRRLLPPHVIEWVLFNIVHRNDVITIKTLKASPTLKKFISEAK